MQSKFYSRLQSSLLLSAGLFLGLATLIPGAEAKIVFNGIAMNGIVNGIELNGLSLNGIDVNGISLNGTNLKFDSASTPQLQLEGSQLILHLNR